MRVLTMRSLLFWMGLCALLLSAITPAFGDIYQYKDADGNWCFTDTPPEDKREDQIGIFSEIDTPSEPKDFEIELYRKYAPENDVEAATLATVTVTSAIGKGSGFFISSNGHLLTNQHVLRGDAAQDERTEQAMDSFAENIENSDRYLRKEAEAIAAAGANLDHYKTRIAGISDRSQRSSAQAVYELEQERFSTWKADFENRKTRYEMGKSEYETEKRQYHLRKMAVNISRNYTVILKDGTVLSAWLVRESTGHDLALLKVDGCKTPYLTPASDTVRQGNSVYAIGNPISLHDSVCRGILSGFEDGFIKTDAKIYPGNSGGPLINEAGEVLGINTFKQLTRNFEGLGFAIPIHTALEEFRNELD